MNDETIRTDLNIFRSPLAPAATVLYALAAVCGLGGAALLLDPGSRAALTEDLMLSGILDSSAISTWQIIHTVIGILAFLCPAGLALGMTLTLRGQPHRGMTVLHHLAKSLHYGVIGSGCLALGVLVYRLGRYILMCLGINGGAYLLYTLLMSEAIMVVQAFLLFQLLRRFLGDCRECAASIGYTLITGKLDKTTWPGFVSTGFLILGIVCLGVAADRLFTLTIVDSFPQDYYAILTTEDPIQLLTGAALLLGGAGDILISLYLRRFKRTAERIIFDARRKVLSEDLRKER